MEVHKLFFSQYLAALSYNVAQILPGDLNKSFFPNSGAEGEGAIKLAYKYFNGEEIIYIVFFSWKNNWILQHIRLYE